MDGSNVVLGVPQTSDISSLDMSTEMLSNLFGHLGPFNGMDNIFSGIMPMWNGLMMSVAGLIVAYTVAVSIISTAHEGEVLGKAWSSIWIPLRTAIGIGMLIPAVGGYSAVQHGVGYIISSGVYIADNMWNASVDYLAKTGGAVIPPHQPDRSLNLIRSAYLQAVCVAATNREYRLMSDPGEKPPQLKLVDFNTRDGVVKSFTDLKDSVYPSDGWKYYDPTLGSACGGYEWTAMSTAKTRIGTADAQGMMSYDFGELIHGNIGDSITSQQKVATKKLIDFMTPIAQNFVETGVQPTLAQLMPAAQTYNITMAESLNTSTKWAENQGMKAFVEQSKKDGWVIAGTFFNRINQLNMALSEAATSGSNTIDMEVNPPVEFGDANDIEQAIAAATAKMDAISKEAQPGVSQAYDDMSSIIHPSTMMMSGILRTLQVEANPLARMQTIGNLILDTVGASITTATVASMTPVGRIGKAASVVSSAVSSKFKGVAGSAMGGMTSMLVTFATTAFLIGILMAVVLPMIPYIIWTLSVISWLVSCVIAVVAASLWAAAHCSPEGHNMSGQGSNGYPILLGLLLRPALMIIGLFAAILVMMIGDTFITKTFMTTFTIANSNNVIGPFIMMGTLVVYATMEMMLLYASFRLIQTIPSAILEWVGGKSDDALGVEHHADRANNMIVGGMTNIKGMTGKGAAAAAGGGKKEEMSALDKKAENNNLITELSRGE